MRLSSRKVAGMFVQLASASEMPLNSIKLHKVMFFCPRARTGVAWRRVDPRASSGQPVWGPVFAGL